MSGAKVKLGVWTVAVVLGLCLGVTRSAEATILYSTGFEDTEVVDSEQRVPVLSGTQYGELN